MSQQPNPPAPQPKTRQAVTTPFLARNTTKTAIPAALAALIGVGVAVYKLFGGHLGADQLAEIGVITTGLGGLFAALAALYSREGAATDAARVQENLEAHVEATGTTTGGVPIPDDGPFAPPGAVVSPNPGGREEL